MKRNEASCVAAMSCQFTSRHHSIVESSLREDRHGAHVPRHEKVWALVKKTEHLSR